jgi:hypothetical protein
MWHAGYWWLVAGGPLRAARVLPCCVATSLVTGNGVSERNMINSGHPSLLPAPSSQLATQNPKPPPAPPAPPALVAEAEAAAAAAPRSPTPKPSPPPPLPRPPPPPPVSCVSCVCCVLCVLASRKSQGAAENVLGKKQPMCNVRTCFVLYLAWIFFRRTIS